MGLGRRVELRPNPLLSKTAVQTRRPFADTLASRDTDPLAKAQIKEKSQSSRVHSMPAAPGVVCGKAEKVLKCVVCAAKISVHGAPRFTALPVHTFLLSSSSSSSLLLLLSFHCSSFIIYLSSSESGPSQVPRKWLPRFPWEIVHILKNVGPRLGKKGATLVAHKAAPLIHQNNHIHKMHFAPRKPHIRGRLSSILQATVYILQWFVVSTPFVFPIFFFFL